MTERNVDRMRECMLIGRVLGIKTYDDLVSRMLRLVRHEMQHVCAKRGLDWRTALEDAKKRDSTATGMPELPDKSPMIDE